MLIDLSYRRGSFEQSETFGSVAVALARAGVLLGTGQCSDFRIDQDGEMKLGHYQIVKTCAQSSSTSRV
jgi:hypothetical protein